MLKRKLWNPYALVFISSGCIMVIELVASRLIAPRIGVSLYTWTSVIGVVLAGISLGNYIGGRLADRYASMRLLGLIYAAAALSVLLALWLNNDLHTMRLPVEVPMIVWIVFYIAAVFLLPCIVLGCISPIVAKLSITDLKRSGTTVGKIYAWSSAGSIAGTFLAGFYLIAHFGTKATFLGVAIVLAFLGLWFLWERPWRRAAVPIVVFLALFIGAFLWLYTSGLLQSECMDETNYFCINVKETQRDGRKVYELLLDRLVHSYTDPNDPTYLVYGYEKTYAGLVAPIARQKPALSAFFIGGGGYTFPRYLEATVPQSRLVVTEIDPGVTEAAHRWLGLPRDTGIVTYNMDTRAYLMWYAEPDAFDVVFGDAFNDYSVPYHLTTLEFTRLVDYILREDGLYMANIIDSGPAGHFLRAFVATQRQVFEHVIVIPSSSDWRTSARMTFVIASSHHPIDTSALPPEFQPLSAAELEAYMAEKPYVVLTDDYVPVDNLMVPVVEASFAGVMLEPEVAARVHERLLAIGGLVGGAALAGGYGWWRWRKQKATAA